MNIGDDKIRHISRGELEGADTRENISPVYSWVVYLIMSCSVMDMS